MKKILLTLWLLMSFSYASAHPQDGMSPDELMRYYVKVFNDENISALEQVYHFPHIKIRNGKLTRFDNTDIPVIDYSELKKSGWKYSKINKIIVLAEGANSALVEMDFSRYDKDDKEFLRSTGYYVLTKNMGYWQILSLNSIGSVTGVK